MLDQSTTGFDPERRSAGPKSRIAIRMKQLDFFAREFWRFVMVQQYVAKLAETAERRSHRHCAHEGGGLIAAVFFAQLERRHIERRCGGLRTSQRIRLADGTAIRLMKRLVCTAGAGGREGGGSAALQHAAGHADKLMVKAF